MGLLTRLIEWILETFLNYFMNRNGGLAAKRDWSRLMMAGYFTGQYEGALNFCRLLENSGIDQGVFHGGILMEVGRLDEAEKVVLQSMAKETNPKLTALAHCTLGEIFLLQRRYDQALTSYQTALRLWPERAATDRAIAAVWLHRGDNPGEALRRARIGFEKERAGTPEVAQLKGSNLSMAGATLAWAVAASSGDSYEVERLVAEAIGLFAKVNPEKMGLFSHIPPGTTPVNTMAQVHLYCGMAYEALGDQTKRANHLEAAANIDPKGAWGREAQRLADSVAH